MVDAIIWVLGAQSAKSLRGKEMADVIFKGSGSGRRKPANSAEATIIFDNSERRFEWDADEVHVTRRVYRSGEGEYLINGQASRLRDIKDLFRGTGVGADAYSLIEQGKVDTVLQASPRDRRAIFEEAAGISRFKAKKVETQRRLERVEQNLLRLSDIVDEVSGRLKRLKSQAGKAQRYQEYNARLQSLRTQVGQVDWQRLSTQLTALETEMAELGGDAEQQQQALRTAEQQASRVEEQSAEALQRLRALELALSKLREGMATSASVMESERQRYDELQEELDRHRGQMAVLEHRARELEAQLADLETRLEAAQRERESSLKQKEQHQETLQQRSSALDEARQEAEQRRQQFVEAMRDSASLGTEMSAHESTIETAQQAMARAAESLAQITAAFEEAEADLDAASASEQDLAQQLAGMESQLGNERDALHAADAELTEVTDATTGLKQREIALRERAGVLEEIESRMEGIGSGVKEVLHRVQAEPEGPLNGIRGMVADLVHVTQPELAELVDVALGERAQHLVVAGTRLFQHLEESSLEVPGRVGFLRLQSTAPPAAAAGRDLSDQQGVIGPAVEFVRTTSEYEHLLHWLLGDTWFVETLADAIQLGRSIAAPLRFVTRHG
ncbi:MAG: chromosome segregation protein SMC, partial [Planctomycetota bacterium]